MNILTIDTADKDAMIILQQENELIDYRSLENNKHAETLITDIEDILLRNRLDYKTLDAISIVNGPGSFMGLKISTSVAKAILCLIPDIKVIINNVFEIVSYNKKYDFVVLDAGLDGFYISDSSSNYYYTKTDTFCPDKNNPILTNSLKVVDILKEYNVGYSLPKKDSIVSLNYLKYSNNILANGEIAPLYIREPQINKKV